MKEIRISELHAPALRKDLAARKLGSKKIEQVMEWLARPRESKSVTDEQVRYDLRKIIGFSEEDIEAVPHILFKKKARSPVRTIIWLVLLGLMALLIWWVMHHYTFHIGRHKPHR